MFAAFFSALKRIFDFTLVPILLAVLGVVFEWQFKAVSWLLIKLLDFMLTAVTGLINLVPFPEVTLDDSVFGSGFMDFAGVIGIWPALSVWLLGGVAALIARMFSFGVVGSG